MAQKTKDALGSEASRIEEDTEHSAKGHYNSSDRWALVHYYIGAPTAILAAFAGVNALGSSPEWAGYLALASASLAAIQTFLNPSDKAVRHKASGDEYLALRNTVRRFREVWLDTLTDVQACERLEELARKKDELNRISPIILRISYERAKQDIDAGRAQYRADKTPMSGGVS